MAAPCMHNQQEDLLVIRKHIDGRSIFTNTPIMLRRKFQSSASLVVRTYTRHAHQRLTYDIINPVNQKWYKSSPIQIPYGSISITALYDGTFQSIVSRT